jgi:phospholipase C
MGHGGRFLQGKSLSRHVGAALGQSPLAHRTGADGWNPQVMIDRRRVAVAAVAISCALATGCGSRPTTSPTPVAVKGSPCGDLPPRSASYAHVIWLWMENHSYDQIIGSGSAPYLNSLAEKCGLATNYHNITHPSLPNYVAATSGVGLGALQRFLTDCDPSPACSTKATSLFDQARDWRAYEESMPTACDRQDSGDYAVRHNPPLYYPGLAGCQRRDVPLASLHSDLAHGSLPSFSFITPNLCHDTHDCPVESGDRWLASEVPQIVDSRSYRSGHSVLFITYDEGEGGSATHCATNQTDVGCQVATVVVSPTTRAGERSGKLFDHYSLLRTTEDLLGLPHLGKAAGAASMAKAFGL